MTRSARSTVGCRTLAAWLLAAMAVVCPAAGGQTAGCSQPTAREPDSHAWAVIPDHVDRADAGACVLVHAPPRTGPSAAGTGFVQFARTFEEWPVVVAAWERTAYLVFEQPGPDGATLVRVRSIEAVGHGLGWDYMPVGRLEPYPTLVTAGRTVAGAGREGTVLLIRERAEGGYAADILADNAWRPLELPPAGEGRWFAWAAHDGLVAAHAQSSVVRTWRLEGEQGPGAFEWISAGEMASVRPTSLFTIGGSVVEVEREGARAVVRLLLPSVPSVLVATVETPTGTTLLPAYAGGPRLLSLRWTREGAAGQSGAYPRVRVTELSLGSGAVLFDGPVPRSEVLSGGEFRMLAMMLAALLIGVLVIVLKGDLDLDSVGLPPDTALAGPGRRFLASLIDLAIAAQVTALLYGIRASELLSLGVLLQPGGAWTALPAMFFLGGLIGTLCEWAFARTLGKFLVGCRVIRVRGRVGGRLGLRGCLLRNSIKWCMPPVAALAAVDENSRHRGDQIAGAAVVIDLEPEPPAG